MISQKLCCKEVKTRSTAETSCLAKAGVEKRQAMCARVIPLPVFKQPNMRSFAYSRSMENIKADT